MLRSLWLQGFGFGWILRLAGLLGGFFDECGGLSWGCSEGRVGGGGVEVEEAAICSGC